MGDGKPTGAVSEVENNSSFTFVDMFAGLGGFHHALTQLGGECVWACDIDPASKQIYLATWPDIGEGGKFSEDVRHVTLDEDGNPKTMEEVAELLPDFDLLCAGFPCQPFSLAGKQLGVLDKTRGTLFHDIITVVKAKQPTYVILENVKNLIGKNHKDTWETIISALEEENYIVPKEPVVLSPHRLKPEHGGTPQNRERVFIIAVKTTKINPDTLTALNSGIIQTTDTLTPEETHLVWNIENYLLEDDEIPNIEEYTLRTEEFAWIGAWNDLLQDIPEDNIPSTLWVEYLKRNNTKPPPNFPTFPEWKKSVFERNMQLKSRHATLINTWLKKVWYVTENNNVVGLLLDENVKKTSINKNWKRIGTVMEFPPSRQKIEFQAKRHQPRQKDRNLWQLVLQLRQSGLRFKPPTYLPALVAITQTSIIASRGRRLTPVEVGRLQGLPDTVFPNALISDKDAYRLAGNAVNVGVVKYLAQQILPHT